MRENASMPRDLLRRRREAGYAAICAVGFEGDPSVRRLGPAENVEAHLTILQPGRWERLHFDRILWTPGMAVARTIVDKAEKFLTEAGHALGNHWFRVEIDVLDDLFRAEAISLNARTWTMDELTIRLKRQADAEADRYARGEI